MVYSIIAFFALVAAFGGGRKEGTKGAIAAITENRAGDILTFALLAGLAGYVAWRLVQAILDADHHGKSWKGLASRFGLLVSGGHLCGAGGLHAVALVGQQEFRRFRAWRLRRHDNRLRRRPCDRLCARRRLRGHRRGAFLACLQADLRRNIFKPAGGGADTSSTALATGGLAARGVIFLIIGVLLVTRGINAGEGGKPPDLSDALEFLQGLPFGSLLLALAGLGLLAFALYSFSDSIWRRIGPS